MSLGSQIAEFFATVKIKAEEEGLKNLTDSVREVVEEVKELSDVSKDVGDDISENLIDVFDELVKKFDNFEDAWKELQPILAEIEKNHPQKRFDTEGIINLKKLFEERKKILQSQKETNQVEEKGLETLTEAKSLYTAIGAIVAQIASISVSLMTAQEAKFAKLNGVLMENVEAFKLLANQANVSEDSVAGAISQISREKRELLTMRKIPMWVRFGINPNQSSDKVLQDILEKVGRYSNDTQKQMALLTRLGVNEELVLMLQEANLQLDDATKKIIKFKSLNSDSSEKIAKNLNVTKTLLKDMMQGLNGIFSPLVEVVLEFIRDLIKDLGGFVIPIFETLGKITKKIAEWLRPILAIVRNLIVGFVKLYAISKSIGAVIQVFNFLKPLFTFIRVFLTGIPGLIALIIASIGLIWKAIAPESFRRFITSIRLIIGDLIDYIKGVPNTVIGDVIDVIKTAVKNLFKDIFNWLVECINNCVDYINEKLNFLEPLNKKLSQSKDWFGQKILKPTWNKAKDVFNFSDDANANMEGSSLVDFARAVKRVKDLQNGITANDISKDIVGNKGKTINNNVDNKVENNITVSTSDNPQAIANAIANKIPQQTLNIEEEMGTVSLSSNVNYARAF